MTRDDRQHNDDGAADGLPAGLVGDLRALVEMMMRGGLTDLQLETPLVRLRLRAQGVASGPATPPERPVQSAVDSAEPATSPAGHLVTAPMIGTFYHSPAPNEPPFVSVGDLVEPGQTVGVIEAMKIMNEIASDDAGIVAEFLAGNGQGVEYGQPLLRLTPPAPGPDA